MDIFNLYAKLSLDKSDYERALGQARADAKETAAEIGADYEEIADKSKETGNKVEKNFKQSNDAVEVSFKGMAVNAIASVVSIAQAAIAAMQKAAAKAKELVDFADRYSDLSAQYDISTQSLQELDYIAGQSSTSLDSLLSSMTMLYNKAQSGDDVFDKLGISVKDANGNMKTMDALFWEVKSALDAVENSGDKSALMLEAFGRNAMSLGEVLRKDTSELVAMADKANKLGLILDNNTINAASDFNDMLAELKQQGMAAFANLLMGAEGSEEMVDQFFDRVMNLIVENTPRLTQTLVKMTVKISQHLLAMVPDMFGQFINEIAKIDWFKVGWDLIKGIAQGIINGLVGLIEAPINALITGLNYIPGVNIPYLDLERVNLLGNSSGDAANTINQSSATSQTLADNSTNNYNITLNATGDVEYDANAVADEVIKRIVVKKQALGRA